MEGTRNSKSPHDRPLSDMMKFKSQQPIKVSEERKQISVNQMKPYSSAAIFQDNKSQSAVSSKSRSKSKKV